MRIINKTLKFIKAFETGISVKIIFHQNISMH